LDGCTIDHIHDQHYSSTIARQLWTHDLSGGGHIVIHHHSQESIFTLTKMNNYYFLFKEWIRLKILKLKIFHHLHYHDIVIWVVK
jgi:hypothetical protein